MIGVTWNMLELQPGSVRGKVLKWRRRIKDKVGNMGRSYTDLFLQVTGLELVVLLRYA